MWKHIDSLFSKISDRQDVILAVFMVSVIFMLIIPLPTWLIDVLIAFNMSIGVILLMVTVYLSSPLNFSSFPAILLITTLFRLALSISTTRLILLQADAGQIVEAFGNFVVGGDLIVGLVVFLILTIVQFVVITKGAERVAEVSARFSLDALPGKQLSIDADMRAGAITLDEARAARNRIQRESKLYGSMDGAMKFVKGDAISSLIIVFVNLIGGLGIGMLERDLSFGDAVHIYSILTIGDGLIAQIPALFISITAGILVTRVTDESQDANLGRDIGRQIAAEPRALMIAAAMLFAFSIIPGFPSIIFVVLGLALGGSAGSVYLLRRVGKKRDPHTHVSEIETPAKLDFHGKEENFSVSEDQIFAPTVPLLIDLPPLVHKLGGLKPVRESLNLVRVSLYYRLGVPLPTIEVRLDPNLDSGRYRIFVGEIPASEGLIEEGSLFILDREENLQLFHIPYQSGDEFISGYQTLWVDEVHKEKLKSADIHFKSPLEVIRFHSETVFAKYAASFLGVQECRTLLTRMEQDFPDLVKEAQRVIPIQTLVELMRRLVQEYVSIRDLRAILGAVIEWGSKEKDPVVLVEHIRTVLSRQISYQYSVGNNILPGFLLDGEIEETVRNAIRQTSVASFIALDPDISRKIVNAVKTIAQGALHADHKAVLITALDIRRYVRRLIELDIPELPVLSFQEITPEITLQPLGRVTLG